MKVTRIALVAALVLSFAAASAFASDIRIIFDPTPDPPPVGATYTNIYSFDIGSPLPVAWQSCSNAGIPSFSVTPPAPIACLALNNVSGQSISELTIDFTVPASLAGQTVDCENADSFLTLNNCPNGTLTTGQQISITLFGGDPVPNNHDMYFGADAAGLTDPSQFPPVTVTAAPEPSTLMLLPIGLLILGLGYGWKRRAAI